ncbi:actin-binding LIM protein 2-like [Panulirus ornatus]|uniref:actin-binding LIM protein 2-like n=1 Tax=Panulirus ornatus TaxID=150431 RepID=UPI003A8A35B4
MLHMCSLQTTISNGRTSHLNWKGVSVSAMFAYKCRRLPVTCSFTYYWRTKMCRMQRGTCGGTGFDCLGPTMAYMVLQVCHLQTVLHGEYMGKDGLPYYEKDYQAQFGVKCAYCNRFISGKVLQAGDNHHFHPTCARCTKCGDPFGDGVEMYLQGTAIWHPRCGPGPTENGTVLNGSLTNGHHINGEQKAERERDFDGKSSTASETQN